MDFLFRVSKYHISCAWHEKNNRQLVRPCANKDNEFRQTTARKKWRTNWMEFVESWREFPQRGDKCFSEYWNHWKPTDALNLQYCVCSSNLKLLGDIFFTRCETNYCECWKFENRFVSGKFECRWKYESNGYRKHLLNN